MGKQAQAQIENLKSIAEKVADDREKSPTKKVNKRKLFQDAPKKPLRADQIFKNELVEKGLEGDELENAFKGFKTLTDDQKCKYHLLAKKSADNYARDLRNYKEQLDENDREQFEETKNAKKPKIESVKSYMAKIFPNKPKLKGIGNYFLFGKENEEKITNLIISQYGEESVKKVGPR